jgi:hypothetical protein
MLNIAESVPQNSGNSIITRHHKLQRLWSSFSNSRNFGNWDEPALLRIPCNSMQFRIDSIPGIPRIGGTRSVSFECVVLGIDRVLGILWNWFRGGGGGTELIPQCSTSRNRMNARISHNISGKNWTSLFNSNPTKTRNVFVENIPVKMNFTKDTKIALHMSKISMANFRFGKRSVGCPSFCLSQICFVDTEQIENSRKVLPRWAYTDEGTYLSVPTRKEISIIVSCRVSHGYLIYKYLSRPFLDMKEKNT